jgi:ATP synthase protein I
MSDSDHERDDDLEATVGHKAERKHRARNERAPVLYWVGMFGLVGWAVAIPTVLGVFAGRWMDRELGGQASWTITMLLVGVALGCLNAWYWIRQHMRQE